MNSDRLLALALLGGLAIGGATAAAATAAPPAVQASTADAGRSLPRKTSPFQAQRVTSKARHFYPAAWGVDNLTVRSTSSGNLIRFSYRVVDASHAQALTSKSAMPVLYAVRSRAVLQVPVMDKVGMLRQAGPPVVGQEYWMVFSNKGSPVKPGDRVNVIIGAFHADGLVVE